MIRVLKAMLETRFPRLFSYLADVRDRRAMQDGEPEMRLLPFLVHAGDRVCDIGANRGMYAYWFLRLGARVVAFEPNPRLVEVLKLRFAPAIRDQRLSVVSCALSDSDGEVVLHIPPGAAALASVEDTAIRQFGTEAQTLTVPRRRLDGCVDGDVAFIKIDVEGHEDSVLEGGSALLEKYRPTLLIEAEDRHRPAAVEQLRARLEPLGYQGFFLESEALHPLTNFEPQRHQDTAALNPEGTHRLKGRAYINNFIFVARPEVKTRLLNWRAGTKP